MRKNGVSDGLKRANFGCPADTDFVDICFGAGRFISNEYKHSFQAQKYQYWQKRGFG
jgi:hypothetical protein